MSKGKAIKVIREIQKREDYFTNQLIFCQEHNFNLEAGKFEAIETEIRRIRYLLQKEFDTGHVRTE